MSLALRVGSDVDGCFDTFGDGVHEALKAKGLGHLWKSGPTKKATWNFFEEWGWTFAQFKELVDWGVDEGIIFSGHWREGAVEQLHRIKEMGHRLIIITDRSWGTDPRNSQRNTIKAFQEAGIEYDELHFTADKTSVKVDVMVEDRLENYDALILAGTPTWLINRPWNEVEGGDARNRIDHYSEYVDAIERIGEQGFADLSFA